MIRPLGWSVCVPRETVQGRLWIPEQELNILRPDHWLDWSYEPIVEHPGYTPMMWSGEPSTMSGVVKRVKEHPGETVLLFNEPDREDQADTPETVARRQTQQLLTALWADDMEDVEFQLAAPGVAINMLNEKGINGLEWAEEYMRQMRRRVVGMSYIHIHSYRGNSIEQLTSAWLAFQKWYRVWGGAKPVVISEVCAENIPDQRRVLDWLRNLLYLGEDGGVVGVYWFSTHPSNVCFWPNACLCEVNEEGTAMQLTDLGKHWLSIR